MSFDSLMVFTGNANPKLASHAPHRIAQALGQGFQDPVSGGVAVAVIHLLEPIQIQEQQGYLVFLAAGGEDGLIQPVRQQAPVGQAGEGVVVGLVPVFGLGLDPGGDVGDGAVVALEMPVPV